MCSHVFLAGDNGMLYIWEIVNSVKSLLSKLVAIVEIPVKVNQDYNKKQMKKFCNEKFQ